ncbi:trypsin-like serine protease [Parapedomonas caeni]
MKYLLRSLAAGASLCAVAVLQLPVTASAGVLTADMVSARTYLKTTLDYQDPMYLPSEAQKNGTVMLRTPIVDGPYAGYNSYCSGTVVGYRTIVTAAHCVSGLDPRDDEYGDYGTPQVRFGGYNGTQVSVASIDIHPLYYDATYGKFAQGAFAAGDIAVLHLSETIPAGTKIYKLFNGDASGEVATHISYGTTGNGDGSNGDIFSLDNLANGRIGKNLYEGSLADLFGPDYLTGAQLVYDFDTGDAANNALPWWASPYGYLLPDGSIYIDPLTDIYQDLGLGDEEVLIDGGDSGGGAFVNGKLAGVHSFGFTLGGEYCDGVLNPNPNDPFDTSGAFNPEIINNPDIDCALNSTFGEVAGDTAVAFYYDWLMARIPEPATYGLMGLGALMAAFGLRRRRA